MMVFDLGGSRFRRDRDRIPDGSPRPRGGGPRLERRNAVRNIDYDADVASSSAAASWSSPSTSDSPFLRGTQSLNHSPSYSSQTSFRIDGRIDGEVDLLCRSLGLSGPEEFSIPAAAWAARKSLSSPSPSPRQDPARADVIAGNEDFGNEFRSPASTSGGDGGTGGTGNKIRSTVGIRGARPPALSPLTPNPAVSALARSPLAPPPSMSCPEIDSMSSTWDLVRSFAPDGDGGVRRVFESDDDEEEEAEEEVKEEEDVRGGGGEEVEVRLGETADDHMESCSFSTSNDDDDSSSTTTEAMFVISPNGKFRRIIRSWMRGGLLGSGSFGTVYEGISDAGIFFAIKEVSLIDQGSNARQCILQLEQEIALLSQFEHENIVQYYGTNKEEAKLFIFLELVTQGSLASLYQKYHLQNSQVSAYTRQILNGLKYLHDRNVVHRDIKCANILVHANGSVKLADFGLAKEITKFNMLKSCKGSAYWMAPEVVNSKREYGPAVDIWSLGCTVLEMLTRQVPYPNLEWTQALFRIGRGEKPPIPKSLSADARDFIRQCVQANPEERPSATQLLDHPFVRRPLPVSVGGSESSSHGID